MVAVKVLGDSLLGPLPCLIPPPLVDLLFAHLEILFVLGSHDFNAIPSPHEVFLELISENLELPLCLALPFAKQLRLLLG